MSPNSSSLKSKDYFILYTLPNVHKSLTMAARPVRSGKDTWIDAFCKYTYYSVKLYCN